MHEFIGRDKDGVPEYINTETKSIEKLVDLEKAGTSISKSMYHSGVSGESKLSLLYKLDSCILDDELYWLMPTASFTGDVHLRVSDFCIRLHSYCLEYTCNVNGGYIELIFDNNIKHVDPYCFRECHKVLINTVNVTDISLLRKIYFAYLSARKDSVYMSMQSSLVSYALLDVYIDSLCSFAQITSMSDSLDAYFVETRLRKLDYKTLYRDFKTVVILELKACLSHGDFVKSLKYISSILDKDDFEPIRDLVFYYRLGGSDLKYLQMLEDYMKSMGVLI